MQPISPATVDLMQAVLRLERAVMSFTQDCDYGSLYMGYSKLCLWYRKLSDESRGRIGGILGYLFANDDIPDPANDAPAASMDAADGVGQAQDLLMALNTAYRTVFIQATTDGDVMARQIATNAIGQLTETLCRIEAKLEMLEAIGQQNWLASEVS